MFYISGIRIVIVNGRPGVGKTTFENICSEILGKNFCKQRSSIDAIKEIAKQCGWNGEKTLKDRKFLSDLKELLVNYNNLPLQDIKLFIYKWENLLESENPYDKLKFHVLFVDIREPKNIKEFKDKLHAITLLIRRPGDDEIEVSNQSDEEVFNYDYDYIIYNNGNLEDLHNKAAEFLNEIHNLDILSLS